MDWKKYQVAAVTGLIYSEKNKLNEAKKQMIINLDSYCDSHMQKMIDFISAAESMDELRQIYETLPKQ